MDQSGIYSLGGGVSRCPGINLTTLPDCQLLQEGGQVNHCGQKGRGRNTPLHKNEVLSRTPAGRVVRLMPGHQGLFSFLYFVPPRLLSPPSSCLWPGNWSQHAMFKDVSIPKLHLEERGARREEACRRSYERGCTGASFAEVFRHPWRIKEAWHTYAHIQTTVYCHLPKIMAIKSFFQVSQKTQKNHHGVHAPLGVHKLPLDTAQQAYYNTTIKWCYDY